MQHSQSRAQPQFPVNPMQMWMRTGLGKMRVQVRRRSVAQDGFDKPGEQI
ncbi:hypothetical protein L208DRAFT_1488706 [Tricholoma matsutake]|nr:hypothetical protein L208DRAFT_1488706 [Tricholoma matsutake 945]